MAMKSEMRQIDAFIRNIEAEVADRRSGTFTKQSFDGTLRVKLDKVFVGAPEGKRAIEALKALRSHK